MQPEKLGRSLSWHSRLSCVSWLFGQKPCIHGLSCPCCYQCKKQLLCQQNPNRLLLKGRQKLSQASDCLFVSVPCFLFPVPRAAFPHVGLQTVKGERSRISGGVLGISSWLECGAGSTKVVASIPRLAIPWRAGLDPRGSLSIQNILWSVVWK